MDYKKILEGVVDIINTAEKSDIGFTNICTYIGENCPELKESEDEKIRQFLIHEVTETSDKIMSYRNMNKKDVLAWLEKQGKSDKIVEKAKIEKQRVLVTESDGSANIDWDCRSLDDAKRLLECGLQYINTELEKQGGQPKEATYTHEVKTGNGNIKALVTEKVQLPKFKPDEWIAQNKANFVFRITSIGYNGYEVVNPEGYTKSISFKHEGYYHLWTIQDAKDGDVLDVNGAPFIYKKHSKDYVYFYCGVNLAGDFIEANGIDTWDSNNKVYPANKEQRDLLFQKMSEAGYEWDEEEKELKKIEQKPAEWKQENVEELSEFENAMMHIGYSFFGERGGLDPNDTSSVKVQAQYLLELAQKPAEWSEEDDDDAWMNDIISKAENNLQLNKAEIDWLKSLRPQPKQEWSEEDENVLEDIKEAIINYWGGDTQDILLDWLKSLKDKYTWKPSKEQMKAIEHICDGNYNVDLDILDSIYRDFKKLREE